jgi:hypothetical protein
MRNPRNSRAGRNGIKWAERLVEIAAVKMVEPPKGRKYCQRNVKVSYRFLLTNFFANTQDRLPEAHLRSSLRLYDTAL